MFGLVEPIGLIPYATDEPAEALLALGLRNYWDTYFAGRAAPLGRAPAEVVHAIFYNFAPGEAARHLPRVWDLITRPDAALAARQQGCVLALRRILGDLVDAPGLARTADLLTDGGDQPADGWPRALRRATGAAPARGAGRPPLARGQPAARTPRRRARNRPGRQRHRRHGSPVLHALADRMPAEKFGRVSHLPEAQLAAVIDGMRARGLIGADGWLTADGRATKERIEALNRRPRRPGLRRPRTE